MDSMPVCCTSRFTTAIQPVLRQFANPELIRKIESEHVWMPLLLIHGAADTHVPAWHSQLVYRFVHDPDEPERSDLWLVPGAGHLEALEVAPEEYVQSDAGLVRQMVCIDRTPPLQLRLRTVCGRRGEPGTAVCGKVGRIH